MNQAFVTGPSAKELLKVEKLLDRIESEMKKKRAENFYASPDKYVNYMNKTTELYTLISEEVISFLDIIGLSDYISTFKKLFRGMQQQIQSMLKFTLHHYSLKNLQLKEAHLSGKHPTIRIGDGITSPTVSFAMKVQKNLLNIQPDQSQPNSEVYSSLGLTSPKYPNEDQIKLNHAGDSIPSLLITDDRVKSQSGLGKNRSSCPPIARKNGINNMEAEQENEFELEAYRRDAERIQMEIDGILESKDSILKIKPTTLAANLKQILRGLEVTKKNVKVLLDESSDEEMEDEVDFDKMVNKLMEACSGAQRKLFQKIVGFMEAKRLSEQKPKQDMETMPDPKILAAGEKKTKKELDQTKQELIVIREKADSLAQEKLMNEEKYAAMMKKHTTCDEDKKKLLQQIAKLEGDMAGLRATAEEMKMAMNKFKQNSARSLVEVVTPSTAKFNQEVHDKLVEQLKEYKAEIEALKSENRNSNRNSVKRSDSIHSTNRQKSIKHGGSMSSNRLIKVQAEDEEYSPDNSFTKKGINEDLEGFTDRGSYPSQIDKSEPAASRNQLGKSKSIKSVKSLSIPPGMNAPRNEDYGYDEGNGYVGSKEEIPMLYTSNNPGSGGMQTLQIEKAKKERLKNLALESFGGKSKSTEDETQQTLRRKFKKDKSPSEKHGGNKSNFVKESSPKKKQNSPQNGRDDDRASPKKLRNDDIPSPKKGKNAVNRFEASSQETTFTKNSTLKENSADATDTSPKNSKQKKIAFSSQNTKQSINITDEVNTVSGGPGDSKSPQVRVKRTLKDDEKRNYKENSDYDQREPKSMLLADKKPRVASMSVDKSVQTDEEFTRYPKDKDDFTRYRDSVFKREDDRERDREPSNLISPRLRSTNTSFANKSLSKLMKEAKESRESHMVRTASGPKMASTSYMNESNKIREQVRQSLMVSFDIKQKLQTLKYEDKDNEGSKQVSTRMKERVPTDLIDHSIEKIDDASDFMSPTYSSVVTAKGEDGKTKHVNPHILKTRTASTFSPARTIDDNNLSPLVNNEEGGQMAVMYNAMLTKAEQDPKILQAIKNFVKDKGEVVDEETFAPNYELFVEFVSDFRKAHQRCGENCSHLQRFYARIGYYHIWNKRSPLAMKKPSLVTNVNKGKTAMKLPNIPEKKVLKMAS